ncbi:Lipid carrier : UDP-N-acetylgalactosaminyltransferase; Putative glycosyltransferase [Rubrivivax sp. A210]|uniref:glycosyltransferase family 4 protein n=1 Tax=Rubrivivax sp. A210 TaxID=2772301 RepID=UPI0019187EF9|nr:glycosyltransferase family 4 protein [Rubrivivax sp. A210]CAD5370707.1 Lipid carrier : UDP-N-acetylgalactosaminyltransferase; Putative glycosyltransferase [Rubrivivax sp. A210]
MKICMICNTDGALYVFRKPIVQAAVARGHQVHAIADRSRYFEKLEGLGMVPEALDFGRHSVGLGSNLRLLWALRQALRRQAPDVVHSFTHKPAIYGTLAARMAGVRARLVTITGLGTLFTNHDLKSRILRFALVTQYRFALRFAHHVFFQNPDDLAYFVDNGIVNPAKAILTNGSGVDLEEFDLPSPAAVQDARLSLSGELGAALGDRTLVVFPARGVREKGFHLFYDAARQIHRLMPGRYVFMHLGLVDNASGSGITGQNIAAYAKDCGVHYLGFKDDIGRYMAAADIVALPSYYREGTPRSMIEALALGKVVVTTDAPGCRETVIDGWNGHLCKPADGHSFIAALLKVDTAFAAAARQRSRALCEAKFDVRHLVALTLEKYGDPVAAAPPA